MGSKKKTGDQWSPLRSLAGSAIKFVGVGIARPFYDFPPHHVGTDALIGPKAPSTKRGLAERSEVWGSLKKLLPL